MANVNIKFNNKDYLLSCDDGQEEALKTLTSYLDKKYKELHTFYSQKNIKKSLKILESYNVIKKIDIEETYVDNSKNKNVMSTSHFLLANNVFK